MGFEPPAEVSAGQLPSPFAKGRGLGVGFDPPAEGSAASSPPKIRVVGGGMTATLE